MQEQRGIDAGVAGRPANPVSGEEPGFGYASGLRAWLESKGITQSELVALTGYAPATLSHTLSGKRTGRPTAALLQRALKIIAACGGHRPDQEAWQRYHAEVVVYASKNCVGPPPRPPAPHATAGPSSRKDPGPGEDDASGPDCVSTGSAFRKVREWQDALTLEVHPAIQVEGAPAELPRYVHREHDEQLRSTLRRAEAEQTSVFTVLIGGSSVGKTRAAFEAVQAELPDWNLWHPIAPTKPDALIELITADQLPPGTVVWLNELQHYLQDERGERAAAALRELLHRPGPFAVIGTLWPSYWSRLVRTEGGDEVRNAQRRGLLEAAVTIDVRPDFVGEARDRLLSAAREDSRLRRAIEATDSREVTQFLAAGHALVEYYRRAADGEPGAWALITAAVDAVRLGQARRLPKHVLAEAAASYLDDDMWNSLPENWLETAFEQAESKLCGAVAPLRRIRPRPGSRESGEFYELADFLDQHGRSVRRSKVPPTGFWQACAAHLKDAVVLTHLGIAAGARGRFRLSELMYWQAAEVGGHAALRWWARRLDETGDAEHADQLRWRIADSGSPLDLLDWARRRWDEGARDEAEALFERGGRGPDSGAYVLTEWGQRLWQSGQLQRAQEVFRRAAETGDHRPLRVWAELVEQRGATERAGELYWRAFQAGDIESLMYWLERLESTGEHAMAVQVADRAAAQGVDGTASLAFCASWLWRTGERERAEVLYARAVLAGDTSALTSWTEDLRDAGLSDRADLLWRRAAQDGDAAVLMEWSWYLARGDDEKGAEQLKERAAAAGDPDELFNLARRTWELGDYERAGRFFHESHRRGNRYALGVWAGLLWDHDDRQGAEALYEETVPDAPQFFQDWAVRVWTAGDRERAGALWSRATDSGWPYGLLDWAEHLWAAGERTAAEHVFREAAARGEPYQLRLLADHLRDAGQVDRAAATYREALDGGDGPSLDVCAELLRAERGQSAAERLRRWGLSAEGELAEPVVRVEDPDAILPVWLPRGRGDVFGPKSSWL